VAAMVLPVVGSAYVNGQTSTAESGIPFNFWVK
jgi:hypothetical protein